MSTVAELALRGVVGLLVICAMFLTIWVARDSSAHAEAAAIERQAESPKPQSSRTRRIPMTHTSTPPERPGELQTAPTR